MKDLIAADGPQEVREKICYIKCPPTWRIITTACLGL